eukprot:gene11046-12210_t
MAEEATMTDSEVIIKRVISECVKAKENSYSPYSGFRVGAAILTDTGEIFSGCNVENVSYGLTICAERVAITKAVSEGHRKFKAIAITCDNNARFLYPCGACRQVMVEFQAMEVYLVTADGKVKKCSMEELLPYSFSDDDLKAEKLDN